jgi:hypothetical protein
VGFLGFFWVGFLLPPCHKDKVKAHVRTVHERVRYGCSTCDYTTPRADKLRRHVAVVHQAALWNRNWNRNFFTSGTGTVTGTVTC